MQEERFAYLFERFYSKEYSFVEREEFLRLVASGGYDEQLTKIVDSKFQIFELDQNPFSSEIETEMLRNILKAKSPAVGQNEKNGLKPRKLWMLFAQAAAILVLIGAGIFYYSGREDDRSAVIVYKNDIEPGHTGATLTLASGERINLNQATTGEIAKDRGISITKSASGKLLYQVIGEEQGKGEQNTLSTLKGETYQVALPDGSQVWLNAASSLTYSTGLHHESRRLVYLQGEAYFEVAKDAKHPFVVESQGQRVEVLGTHFNINAYPGETGKRTTLLEGSVKVSEGTVQQMLQPGYEAFSSEMGIQVQSVDTELSVGWKNGKIVFENQKIQYIMKMVEHWYNVEIIYSGEKPEDVFGGSVSRFDNVSHVLNILESTGRVHFKIDGRKIYVSK